MSQVIYKIINLVNDKFYVGSTTNKKVRFRQHRKLLRGNRHHCKHLQAAWNKYGEAKFDFVVIEEVENELSLQEAEDRYLKEHVGKEYCYNSGATADAPWRGVYGAKNPKFGVPRTDSEKQQISATLKEFYAEDYFNHPRVGKSHSEETRAKISASKIANPVCHWQGKERSEETRQKIGDSQRGVKKAPRTITEEGKAKIRAAAEAGHYSHWEGRKHTKESRAKMSKPIHVMPDDIVLPSLTAVLEKYGLKMPTLSRALKSGNPITKGKMAGHSFKYLHPNSVKV